jgi:hypothetical protein
MLYIILGTVEGSKIHIENISVIQSTSATITYKLITQTGIEPLTHVLEGQAYTNWVNDNTTLFNLLCVKHGLQYVPYVEPEFFQEVMVWRDEVTGAMMQEMITYPNPNYIPT